MTCAKPSLSGWSQTDRASHPIWQEWSEPRYTSKKVNKTHPILRIFISSTAVDVRLACSTMDVCSATTWLSCCRTRLAEWLSRKLSIFPELSAKDSIYQTLG